MSKATATNPDPFGDEVADFVIVTALEKEAQAVVRRLEGHAVRRFEEQDIRTYHCGTIPIHDTERAYRIVVVLLPSMGEVPAATAVTDAIVRWNPRFVLMVGIAGGIPQDDLDLGDVVVADQIIGYEYGKVTDEGIQPRDRVYPVSALLLDRVRSFWDDSWTGEVNVRRPDNAARPVSKRFVGPIASGNKVIASTEFRQRLKARWSELTASEMEGEGVFGAVFDRSHRHRGGMRLHEADCRLEYARLHLACGDQEAARESFAKAKAIIEEMGYHRRDAEVAEMEEKCSSPRLGGAPCNDESPSV